MISDKIYHKNTPVTKLVDEIEQAATARGFTLSRWQSNGGHFATTITYAIHTGPRAIRFFDQSEDSIIIYTLFNQIEGKTEKCTAYKNLKTLLHIFELTHPGEK